MPEEILSTTSIQFYIYIPSWMSPIWPMAREYSVWNAAVAVLQFWTADLKAHVLSSVIEQVYNTFFYSTSTHLLCQLVLEDEGYESGSENFNIPTPLRGTSKIHHVSSHKNISFDPVTPCSAHTSQSHSKPVWCWLTFSSSDNDDDTSPVDNSLPSSTVPAEPCGFCTATALLN